MRRLGAAFPKLRLGGGMFSYFTELNRKRVPAEQLDFITHCTCPIVHAADDLSVMQSLEALPFITRSVRALFGDKPYRIGPSTIAMRQNPYGSATKRNPDGRRIAMAERDPRHDGLFAAAWAVGYAARVVPAGLEQLTLSGFAGTFGLLGGRRESRWRRDRPGRSSMSCRVWRRWRAGIHRGEIQRRGSHRRAGRTLARRQACALAREPDGRRGVDPSAGPALCAPWRSSTPGRCRRRKDSGRSIRGTSSASAPMRWRGSPDQELLAAARHRGRASARGA